MPVPVKTKEKVSPHTINLNSFARFLLENHLKEFAEKSIAVSRQRKVPLLKYLDGMPVSALKVLAEKGAAELLTSLANNKATEYLGNSVQRWLTDQLPM